MVPLNTSYHLQQMNKFGEPNDDQIVQSTIQLDPYFQKNSDRFLREKTFFEINQRMAEARKLTGIDKIKDKSTDQTSEKSFSPTTETTMSPK